MIYSDILRRIKTVDQARELNSEIDILLDNLFKTETNAFEKELNSISAVNSQMLKEILIRNYGSFENKAMIKEYLIGLKEEIQKLKVLKLSLAFEVSKNSIDNLFTWVLKNQGVGIILDIKTDKSLLGGVIIEFNGKYKDLSLRKALEEAFQNKRGEILKIYKDEGL